MSYAETTITINFDQWIDNRNKDDDTHHENWRRDIQGLYFLDQKCHLAGFMTGPVATWKGMHVQAVTLEMNDLIEFVHYCEDNVGSKLIFLYDLHYNIGMPTYASFDSNTFEPTYFDRPVEYEKAGWKIRYGEV